MDTDGNGLFSILREHGTEVTDADEETFELFSEYNCASSLGMVDAKTATVDLEICGRDFIIHQSHGLLKSNREGGTTGAALWKITPAFASWIASPYNFLFRNNVLNADSVVLELGAGISGIVGLCLAPLVKQYILTDQEYVLKMLKQNVDQNKPEQQSSKERHRKTSARDNARGANTADRVGRLEILPLDWETSDVRGIESQLDTRPSILVAADCIFNPAIIGPFVSTLADLSVLGNNQGRPVISFIAQQLRSPDVFAEWLETMLRRFNVWRIREKALHVSRSGEDARLAISNGFLVHVCFLRDETSSYKHH